jgi:hypothetical protein
MFFNNIRPNLLTSMSATAHANDRSNVRPAGWNYRYPSIKHIILGKSRMNTIHGAQRFCLIYFLLAAMTFVLLSLIMVPIFYYIVLPLKIQSHFDAMVRHPTDTQEYNSTSASLSAPPTTFELLHDGSGDFRINTTVDALTSLLSGTASF